MRRLTAAALGLCFCSGLTAQAPPRAERATDASWPPWMDAWSPLLPLADLPRHLPATPRAPDLLGAPAPRIGLFWTAGVPAAIALDVGDSRSELRAGAAWDNGRYRRPLDHGVGVVGQLAGIAWRPIGAGAAAGRVTVDQENLDPASFAVVTQPFTSNPLVVTDTSLPRMRLVRARLEGAFGWNLGAWGVGLAAGVEVRDHRTVEARFPRLVRQSLPGLSAGVARALPIAGATLAAYGRWTGGDETLFLIPEPGTGTVYQLQGYSEPDRRQVSQRPAYFRRMDRDAYAVGLGVSGRVAGAAWVAFGERSNRDESHVSARLPDPPTDRWSADGWSVGAAVQRGILGDRLLLTGQLRYDRVTGAATRGDLEGDIFRARESALQGSLGARYAPPASPWLAALSVSLLRERRLREDFIDLVASDVEGWTPGVSLEVARRFGAGSAVALGFAAAAYSSVASIPNPEPRGPVYQRVVGPELGVYAARAVPLAASVTLRQRVGERTALVLRARRELLEPEGESAAQLTPEGRRKLSTLSLAIVLEG